jgi:cytochrome c oxidase subunit IV
MEAHAGTLEVTPKEHAHPGPKFYVMVGVILTAVTAVEVAVYYIAALHSVMVPILVMLSATKFAMVVMFYMHLRFDARLFSGVFVAPLILGLTVVVSLIILFRVLPYAGG